MTLAALAGRSAPDPQAPPCALCGATGAALRHVARLGTSPDLRALGAFRVVLCARCLNGRTVPLPGPGALTIPPDVAAPALGVVQRALLSRFIANRVARVRPLVAGRATPRVVDIGGGACLFANALARAGCAVTVFEPNAANAGAAGPGVRFIGAPFDEKAVRDAGVADGAFDLVTMWHALEHLTDPLATLRLARRLLAPGGAIHVCVPNIGSLQAGISGNRWCYLDVPHHVTHFSVAGLARALRDAGFAPRPAVMWNAEYEIFGFYQSMLNLLTGSHNYFYNRAKKGRVTDAGPAPAWTKLATAAGPLLLPLAVLASWAAAAIARPACAEIPAEAPA